MSNNKKVNELRKALELYESSKEKLVQYRAKLKTKNRIDVYKGQYDLLLEVFDNATHTPNKLKTELYVRDECARFIIPALEMIIKDTRLSDDDFSDAYNLWQKFFALTARRSLHHFIIYMEMDRTDDRRVYLNKRDVILEPFAYYFTEMMFDPTFKFITDSKPPSSGKTFSANYGTAWIYGVDNDSSVLRMSVAEDNVLTASTNIKEILMDKRYGEIFPHFAKLAENKPSDIFSSQKVNQWKISGSDVENSHMAVTIGGQIEGKRANKLIIVDDTLKMIDSGNEELMKKNWDIWNASISARGDGGKEKHLIIGTMWHPNDLLGKKIDEELKYGDIRPGKFKYTEEVYQDNVLVGVIIRTPMLDYDTDETTCKYVLSTEEAQRKRAATDEFLWQSAYQQRPIPPKGRLFEYDNLKQWDSYLGDKVVYQDYEVKLSNNAYMAIDPVRKGTDFVACPIFKVSEEEGDDNHYLIDVIFKGISMAEIYEDIVNKIFLHNITRIALEINTDTSLKDLLLMKIRERNIAENKNIIVEIDEKYNTVKKDKRIRDNNLPIRERLVFPKKDLYPPNSQMGKFMNNFTSYSTDLPNRHDDAPDSLALYVNEIIREQGNGQATVEVFSSRSLYG